MPKVSTKLCQLQQCQHLISNVIHLKGGTHEKVICHSSLHLYSNTVAPSQSYILCIRLCTGNCVWCSLQMQQCRLRSIISRRFALYQHEANHNLKEEVCNQAVILTCAVFCEVTS